MRGVAHDAAKHFFDLESGWLRTVRELTLAPGRMILRYVEGHRKVYANPFAYLVFGTAASFVVQKLIGFQARMVATTRTNAMDSPLQMELINSFTELVFQNTLYISFGILVPMAVLVRLFFRKSGYNLAETFVFALYTAGHLALLGVVLIPLYMLLPPSGAIQAVVSLTVAIGYMIYAARGFFKGGFWSVAIKTGIAYVMAYGTFMVVMMVCVIVYVLIVLVPSSTGVEWDLVTATDYEMVPVVEKLLDDGADMNATSQRTSLHAAAANGNLEIVELLIQGGAGYPRQDAPVRGDRRAPVRSRQAAHRGAVRCRSPRLGRQHAVDGGGPGRRRSAGSLGFGPGHRHRRGAAGENTRDGSDDGRPLGQPRDREDAPGQWSRCKS